MNQDRFRVPGKWVLAGEHAVLRGATAVALPHPEYFLSLEVTEARELTIFPQKLSGEILDLLKSIRDRWEDEDRSFPQLTGNLSIVSSIPMGAGLGSSAALSVAFTKWLARPLGIHEDQFFEFAKSLEHRFHGRSSGMDVAAVLAGEPISFSIERGSETLGVKKLPKFTFHDTGLRARTSECVLKVEAFRAEQPMRAMQIDEQMSRASQQAIEGLISGNRAEIASAMQTAHLCFESWQLIPTQARDLEQKLLAEGALAVKITGAGGGGFLVALWK